MSHSKLKKIIETFEEGGIVGGDLCAEHDIIYLCPPGEGPDEDSEFGQKLVAAGAHYDENDGWYVNV